MKFFVLEVGTSEPRQFRITSIDGTTYVSDDFRTDDRFKMIGVWDTPAECLQVLQSYLRLEETK